MSETVKQGGCEFFTPKDLHPLSEREICRDEGGAFLVPLGEEIEEELSACSVEGDEAKFVDEEQLGVMVSFLEKAEPSLITRFSEFADKICGSFKNDSFSPSAGFDSKSDGKVSFSCADRTSEHDVVAAVNVLATCQLQDFAFWDPLQRRPVNLIECFDVREPRLFEPFFSSTISPSTHFQIQQIFEVILIKPSFVARCASNVDILSANRRELELLSVLCDDDFFYFTHDTPPASRWL